MAFAPLGALAELASSLAPVVAQGHITGRRVFENMEQILVSCPIVGGNSGGPVLASGNEIIGIASRGPSDNAEGLERQMSTVTEYMASPISLLA